MSARILRAVIGGLAWTAGYRMAAQQQCAMYANLAKSVFARFLGSFVDSTCWDVVPVLNAAPSTSHCHGAVFRSFDSDTADLLAGL